MENRQKAKLLNKRNLFTGIAVLNGVVCFFIINRFSPVHVDIDVFANQVMTAFVLSVAFVYGCFTYESLKKLKHDDSALVMGITKQAYMFFMQLSMLAVVVASYFLGEVYMLSFLPLHVIIYVIEKRYPHAFAFDDLASEKTSCNHKIVG